MNTKRNQVAQTLREFYAKPVAKVSSELLFSIFAVIFFAVFAIKPTILTMSNLIKEIQDKQILEQKLTEKIASLSTVQRQYLDAQDRLVVLDKALPSSPELETALLLVEKVASENNIAIVNAEAKVVPTEDPVGTEFSQKVRLSKPISFTVAGTYPDIAKFVEGIRNLQREMIVESVSFGLTDSQGKKRLTAVVIISVQYFGLPNDAASPTAAPAIK
ncbi:hypothetical protein BH10PAT2_BH10PAT2_0460 [soil metagenome]